MKSILFWLHGLPMTETEPDIQQKVYAALTLHQAGKLKEARSEYRKLLRQYPDNADILHLNGMLLHQMGQTNLAIKNLTQAAALAPQNLEIHLNLFRVLATADNILELERILGILVELSPMDAFLLAQLGEVHVRQGRADEAEPYFRRSVDSNPETYDAWNGLGNILERRGEFGEAEDYYQKSIEIAPNRAEARYNLGNVLRQQNKVAESIEALRKALELDPEFKLAHVHLAFSLFMNGDFEAAWPEYEWRWKVPNFPTPERPFSQPKWDGERLDGKTILVHTEQGFGDTIQFARFTKTMADLGGDIILECAPGLTSLMESAPGVTKTLARGDALPAFDAHVPLLSIPGILSMEVGAIPKQVPYLQASVNKQKYWADRLKISGKLKVGITWQTSTEQLSSSFKSCPLQDYSALFEFDEVNWISLQKEIPASDLPLPTHLMDISGDLADFSDTAAVISELDLVISMDTAVAHLAGALGKPTWLLLSTAGDWRWMKDRSDSPWYPTMQIVRQVNFNDWNEIMMRIRPQIENLIVEKELKSA
jgi:tetratricopeptide (TPR) repeat protein